MRVRPVCLDVGDAVELGEFLEFVVRWLDSDDDGVAGSLQRFVGHGSYGVDELRMDVARFAFLVGGRDGERLVGGDER